MNADGSGETQLTANIDSVDGSPTWSPDGTKIAFLSSRDIIFKEIYVMNADGTGVTRLTNNNSDDVEPSWSPDGTKIAFRSERDGDGEIFVMNADGTGQTKITDNMVFDIQPNWQRLTEPPSTQVIGGEIIPIEQTSLLLAGAQTFSWMLPILLSGLGIGFFVVSRKSENT